MNAEEIKLVINPIMETGDIKTAVNQIQGFFNKMNLSKGMKGDMESIFRELIDEAETFEKKSKEAFKTSGDVKSFENSAKKIETLFGKINNTLSQLEGTDLKTLFQINSDEITQISKEIADLKVKLDSLKSTELDKVSEAIKKLEGVSKSKSINGFFQALQNNDLKGVETHFQNLIGNIQAFGGATDKTKQSVNTMLTAFQSGNMGQFNMALEELKANLADDSNIKTYVLQIESLGQILQKLGSDGDIAQIISKISLLENNLSDLELEQLKQMGLLMQQAKTDTEKLTNSVREHNKTLTSGARAQQEFNREISELKSRAVYFLGLENSVDLFRQGVQKAFEAVKELDKAMAETAVVTDFNMGDMWSKLPEYTKIANELGVTTQGVYEASTLYYQQGLKTEEVMALTTETLKMARIAGLECANATNLMTAALRGFNMEINETSAQRVNDVYSELAAITAADTKEIATAMTKTASIAASANMELETTAALLAQMIETTREPAETAGTAMKTIIARFTEMKKATSDIVSVDGEEVSVNKVDAALASVGVSLKNANGEFRELDDVLLELASKWNNLDIMSQRYIATTAAGSRQQSRFIAMMQDYDRTMELVDAAYNSAGSSEQQFEKTQESLESKINKLENAWKEFLMGIANSTVIKSAVDLLTGLINVINKFTTVPGDNIFSSLASSALKLAAVLATLRGVRKGIEYLFPESAVASTGLGAEIQKYKNNSKAVRADQRKQRVAKAQERDSKIYKTFGLQDSTKKIAEKRKEAGVSLRKRRIEQLEKEKIRPKRTEEIRSRLDTLKKEEQAIKNKHTFRKRSGGKYTTPLGDEEKVKIGQIKQETKELEAELAKLDAQDVDIDIKAETERARAEVARLEQEIKKDPLNEELYLQKSQAEAELEFFESQAKDDINKDVDVRLQEAKMELETFEKSEESDPIVKRVITKESGPTQGLKGQTDSLKTGFKNIKQKAGEGLGKAKTSLKELPGNLKTQMADKISPVVSSMGALLPLLAGAVAAVGAIAAVWAVAWYTDPVQKAQREVDKLSVAAKSAAQSFEHLRTSIQSLEDGASTLSTLKEELNDLVPGSEAYNQKLSEINEATAKLLEQNSGLILEGTNSPYAEINQGSYDQALKELKKKESIASGTKIMLNADLAVAEKELDAEKQLDDLEKKVNTSEFLNILAGVGGGALGLVTGFLGGGLLGAGAGAGVGALAGGVGAAPGAIIGALGGAALGGIGGTATGAAMAYDKAREAQAKKTEEYKEQEAILQRQVSLYKRSQDETYKMAILSGLGSEISEENKTMVSNALLNNLEERKEAETKEIKKGANKANKKEIQEWAERSNYEYRDGKVYDSEGNEVTVDKKAVAEQLSYMRALEKTQNDAKVMESQLKSLTGEGGERISQLFSGDPNVEISESQINDIMTNYGENGVSSLQKDFEASLSGLSNDKKKEVLAAYLGIDPEDIDERQISKYVDEVGILLEKKTLELVQQQKEKNAYLQQELQTLIGGDLTEKSKFSKTLSDNFGNDGMEQLTKFRGELENTFGAEYSRQLTLKIALNGDTEKAKEALTKINQVNFSDPINGFKELNVLASDSNEVLSSVAKEMLNSPIYALENQLKTVYTNLVSNKEAMEDIKKYLEDDIIDAGEVLELSENFEQLAQFMETTEMSASSLAKVLTGLEKGTITLKGLTSAVLKAISGLSAIEDSLEISAKSIEKFTETLKDSMQNLDELATIGEDFDEMITNKEYGNLAVTQTIGFIYGTDTLSAARDNVNKYVAFLEKKQKEITKWNEYGGMGFWKDLASDENYERVNYNQNGTIGFDVGNMTTDEIIESISVAKDISEEAARIYWEAYVAHSPDAQAKVEQNEKNRAIENFINEKSKQSNEGLFGGVLQASKKEIENLASFLDKEYDEIITDIESKGHNISPFDFKEDFTVDAIISEINRVTGQTAEKLAEVFSLGASATGENIIDFEAMKNQLMTVFSLTETQAESVINNIANNTGSLVGKKVVTGINESGEVITQLIAGVDTTSLTNKVNSALDQTQSLGELLASQDYTGVASVLAEIMDKTSDIFKHKLLIAVMDVLKAMAKGILTFFGLLPDPISELITGTIDLSFDVVTEMVGGDAPETEDQENNTEKSFSERMQIRGFSSYGDADNTVKGSVPTTFDGNNGYFKKGSPSSYTDAESGFSYIATPITYVWEKDGQEITETVTKYEYYDKNGNLVDAEAYEKATGKSSPTTGYIPPKETDTDNTKEEERNYAAENQDRQLEALDRIQGTLDREAELIDKLPEELAAPLKLMNMGENLAVEIKRDEVERNKLLALEGQRSTLQEEAKYLGKYFYFDENLDSYMYMVDEINALDKETRAKVEEEYQELQENQNKINETRDAVSGGKIQKVFYGLEKQTENLSKAFEKNAKNGKTMAQTMLEIFEDTPLEKFKYLASGIGQTIDNTNLLNKSYKGLINDTDKVAEIMSNLEETPLGQKLGESTKDLIGHILGGGTGNEFAGAATGALSEMFGGIGDFLTFDVMGQGMEIFNQVKGMAEKAIQTIVQYIQTIVNWWINREDWLYNLLTSIEKEVQNLNRQDQVEERFRLYSDDGYDELLTAWYATQASLKKQIELNEQLIKSRQAELQGLNLQNILFYPAFHYNRKQDRVVENPWVYNIYTLLLDLGANLPLIGGIFSSIKSLMEDNKKRMENITSEIDETRQQLDELEKRQLEENRKFMEDEIELEQLVMDTIIEKQQEEIDELTLMHDAITEGNEKLIETLNSKLELIRQQRDNTDKEEELAEKERRLAYLRQNTSGANRAEILKLSEGLQNERRDYTDELIDQKISALEEQNDKAAEQRQKQIDLLQSQLDYTEKYGLQWEEAQQLIRNGFDSKGQLRVGTDLYNMLMSKEEFTSIGLGSTQQFQQLDDWQILGVAAALYRTINDVFGTDFSPKGDKDVYNEDARGYYDGETWWEYLIKNIKQLFSTYLNPEITPSWAVKIIDWLKQRFPHGSSILEFDNSGMAIAEPISKSIIDVGRETADKTISAFTDGIDKMGKSFTEGIKEISNSGTLSTQTSTQTVGDINMEFHINSEDGESGMDIAESIVSAFKQGISNLSIFK